MFGHNDQGQTQDNQGYNQPQIQPAPQIGGLGTPPSLDPNNDAWFAANPLPAPDNNLSPTATTITPQPSNDMSGQFQPSQNQTQDQPQTVPAPVNTGLSIGPGASLLELKSQALHQLAPLVNHLDQSPEEKFRTTMMMIQASDNQDLIQDAYEAANQIQDEKSKAQALLDVVNEINYFTQQQSQN